MMRVQQYSTTVLVVLGLQTFVECFGEVGFALQVCIWLANPASNSTPAFVLYRYILFINRRLHRLCCKYVYLVLLLLLRADVRVDFDLF